MGSARLLAVDCLLEVDAGRELGDLARGDLDERSGLRIAPVASLALRDGKRAEADEGHAFAFFQGSGDAVHERVDGLGSLGLAALRGAGDPVNEMAFIHRALLGRSCKHPTPRGFWTWRGPILRFLT